MISSSLVKIHHTYPKLLIDQQPCRDDLDQRTSLDFMRVQAQKGWQAAKDGVVRRASEGARLMRIENKEERVIQKIAWENTDLSKEFNIAFLPETPPKITYVPGELEFQYVGNNFDRKG